MMEKRAQLPSSPTGVCLEGERACPPDDCGGEPGYDHLLDVLADPTHDEYEDLRQWSGNFDPERVNPKDATRRMREYS